MYTPTTFHNPLPCPKLPHNFAIFPYLQLSMHKRGSQKLCRYICTTFNHLLFTAAIWSAKCGFCTTAIILFRILYTSILKCRRSVLYLLPHKISIIYITFYYCLSVCNSLTNYRPADGMELKSTTV
jgi:hypothetical protein